MYPVLLFASIFPYSKQKSTYTCCLYEVHSVLKEKKVARTSNFLVASARLAKGEDSAQWNKRITDIQYIPHSCRKKAMPINHTATVSINYTPPPRAYSCVEFVFTSRSPYTSYIKMNGFLPLFPPNRSAGCRCSRRAYRQLIYWYFRISVYFLNMRFIRIAVLRVPAQ
jgi:hypothetical protein